MIPSPIKTNSPDNLVFLDVETTGLSVDHGARVCEIAMLKTENGVETEYSTLVNPGHPILPRYSQIHGITNSMVKDAPLFGDIAQNVANFIDGSVLVCHNAPFDLGFISKQLMECGVSSPEMYYLDTLIISRQYFSFQSNKLGDIARTLDIEIEQAHRAMSDVRTMQGISKYLFSNLYRKGIDFLEPTYFAQSLNIKK
ncbi:MAG: 3'-5' exonuclease [Elusimicrobia bacterium]|nr:3'-5' exonuclease [Elusimicrobiota bacterium]